MTADVINGLFEFGGGAFALLNCARLYRDKTVAGVSLWAALFFTIWALWNLVYYPLLGQWHSATAAALVLIGNSLWLALALRYR